MVPSQPIYEALTTVLTGAKPLRPQLLAIAAKLEGWDLEAVEAFGALMNATANWSAEELAALTGVANAINTTKR